MPGAAFVAEISRTLTRAELRWEFLGIAMGVALLLVGLAAISVFLLRRRAGERTLVYFGLFSTLYGVRLLAEQSIFRTLWDASPRFWELLRWFITCTILLPLSLFLYELADERLRKLLRWVMAVQGTFAVIGIVGPIAGVGLTKFWQANNAVVLGSVAVGVAYLLWRRMSAVGGTALSMEARVLLAGVATWFLLVIHINLHNLGILPGEDIEPFGFLILVGCLAYVSAQRIFANEEHLLAISKELDIARQIQSSTLPREVPKLPSLQIAARYVPMSAVAGDFYDFLLIDDHHVGVLVADVTGHGVPAALIASMLKVAFAAQVEHAADPARVLTGLNRALCGKFEAHFVTAAYVFADLQKGVLRYAGAGHPPLMWASRSSGNVRQIEENGLMLGLFPEATYTSMEIPLDSGDRCLLYTDGVFEAMNAAQEEFGKPRLAQFLKTHPDQPAESFTRSLLEEVSRWAGHGNGRRQDDDITVLTLDFARTAEATR